MLARKPSSVARMRKAWLIIAAALLGVLWDPAGASAALVPCPVQGTTSICTIATGDTVFSVSASSDDGGSLIAVLYAVNGVNQLTFQGFALYDGDAEAFTSFELVSAQVDATVPQIVVQFAELGSGDVDATVIFQLTDSGDTSTLTESAKIGTVSQLGFQGRLYMLTSWRLNDTPFDDSILITDGDTAVQVDGGTTGTVEVVSPKPAAFDAAVCCTLISDIIDFDTAVELQNRTSAPGPNLFESAFAWDFGIEPGTDFTATVRKTLTVAPVASPTPTATPTAIPTATPTAIPTATPTATPSPGDGAVLILGPTVFGGLSSNEAQNAIALGYDVDVATAAEWGAMSAADFASYKALILGDTCGGLGAIAAAEANREVWSSVTTGNIVLIGTDPSTHSSQGGDQVNNRGINFAASGDGTGLFATLSCYYHGAAPMTNVPVLDQYGAFTVTGVGCFDDAHIVAENPALDGLTDANLSNWGCSVHEAFDSFPSTFIPLAIAQGAVGAGSLNFADGSSGIPYILARGASPIFCGDGNLDVGFEECDDGNTLNGDGCSSVCTIELLTCGDGVLDEPEEQCDDENTDDGDGCSSRCQFEDPIVHAPHPLPNWPEALQFNYSTDHAHIALKESGIDIHNVSDRDNPIWTSNFLPDSECSPRQFSADELGLVEQDGDVGALVSANECGVVAGDFTDSSNPIYTDHFSVPFGLVEEIAWTESADGQNLILYVASFWQGFKVFEIVGECGASGCTVVERGSIGADDEWGASLAVWVEEKEGQILVYVASTEGLQIVDVTDPDNPILLGRLDTNPTDIPLNELDDVPQDVVVSGGLAFVPIWIGGFIVVDVQDPTNPIEIQRIAATPGSAFFKVEVSSRDNRIYVTEGIEGVAVFRQLGDGTLTLEERFPIGEGDLRCFDGDGESTGVCWAWSIDEHHELFGAGYGVLDSPLAGGYQLISMPTVAIGGGALKILQATPLPEPSQLLVQGVGALAVAGLARLRRRRRGRPASH